MTKTYCRKLLYTVLYYTTTYHNIPGYSTLYYNLLSSAGISIFYNLILQAITCHHDIRRYTTIYCMLYILHTTYYVLNSVYYILNTFHCILYTNILDYYILRTKYLYFILYCRKYLLKKIP